MENQHRKISGYRELAESEIFTMNMCKDMEVECGNMMNALLELDNTDKRCVSIARTKLQEAFMWAVRSIAKPDSNLNP